MNNTIEKRASIPFQKALYFSHNFCKSSLAERTSDLLTKHSSSSPFLVALKVFLLPLVWVPPELYISSTVSTEKELLNYSHFGQIKKWAGFRQTCVDSLVPKVMLKPLRIITV